MSKIVWSSENVSKDTLEPLINIFRSTYNPNTLRVQVWPNQNTDVPDVWCVVASEIEELVPQDLQDLVTEGFTLSPGAINKGATVSMYMPAGGWSSVTGGTGVASS